LYAVLGDREAQNAIRAKHPNEKHCPMLRESANACTGCKNNPYESKERQAAIKKMEAYSPLLNRAFRLHMLGELGLLKIDDMTTADIEILQTVHEEVLATRMKTQAVLIAQYVSEMFAGSK
jgi:hypothetical protein